MTWNLSEMQESQVLQIYCIRIGILTRSHVIFLHIVSLGVISVVVYSWEQRHTHMLEYAFKSYF